MVRNGKAPNICERTFRFSVRITKLCEHLERRQGVARTLGWQLLRAGTSIGANVEEAQAGQTKADFITKNAIALKEARETHYWLRLLGAADVIPARRLAGIEGEVQELMRILGAILVSARKAQP